MTPTEFEILTQRLLAKRLKKEFGREIEVHHGRAYTSPSGITHHVDVSYSFELIGLQYLTIVECKLWGSPVPKSVVAALDAIVTDLGAHKGIVVSPRGFQSGSIAFAQSKGIGLFKILNEEIGEVLSHFDGGLAKIGRQLLEDEELIESGNFESVGLFFPLRSPYEFIASRYGKELAQFLEHEYSADILDGSPSSIPLIVRRQLRNVPEDWHKEYVLVESAGLGYKLANEADLRVIGSLVWMLKSMLGS